MVSVIIPCYNAERWIKECLISVINQTYSDIEILVIDDGSNDQTATIVNALTDKRISYYYKANGGHSSARNHGLKKANGNWIAFLDSDDIWEKTKLQTKLNKSENYDILYSNFNIIDKNNQVLKTIHITHPKNYNFNFKKEILFGNIISGGSCIILRKEVINNIGEFNTKLQIGEDWDYWARAIWANYKIKFVDKKLNRIRCHDNSTQRTTENQVWNSSMETILKSFLSFNGISDKEKSYVYKKLTMVAYRFNNNFRKYFGFYLNAVNLNKWMLIDPQLLWLTFKFLIRVLITKIR